VHRRAEVAAAVAASPQLTRRLNVQIGVAAAIREVGARIEAPARLRAAIAEERRGPAIPPRTGSGSTCMTSTPGAPSLRAATRRHTSPAPWWLVPRVLGALATLTVGAVHLHEYFHFYSAIPTIGTLFVLNFAAATVIGLGLLAPVERLAGHYGAAAVTLLALAGIGLAATAFVFLAIAEHTPVFGFQEPGYDPAGIAASRISEIAAVVTLAIFLVARTRQHRRST
jgi:hypothetical protein